MFDMVFVVFLVFIIVEFLIIVFVNIFIIYVFWKYCIRLRRKFFFFKNLVIVDLLVGLIEVIVLGIFDILSNVGKDFLIKDILFEIILCLF